MGLEVVPKIQTLFIRTLAKPLGKLSRDLGDPSGAAEITTPPDRTRAAPRAMQRSPAAVRTPKGSGDRVMARGGPVGGRGGSSPESFDSSLNQWDLPYKVSRVLFIHFMTTDMYHPTGPPPGRPPADVAVPHCHPDPQRLGGPGHGQVWPGGGARWVES